ncbi:MAG TPA: ABC-F family ATP-binding cassette domain-containing protein [Capsulimonadaceae bacterium]|jgi:ATP-binding cassette subfamily F protein 3
MSLLSIGNITKLYGATMILDSVSGSVAQGERIALVGINGAGKSTLLRIIAGHERADKGSVALARGRKLGFLTQEAGFDTSLTLIEALRSVFASVDDLGDQMRLIEAEIATAPEDEQEALLQHYGHLVERFESGGGYDVDSRISRVMAGLGFTVDDRDLSCGSLSGGQRTRAALAQLLLAEPDVLLLDEPTNHLDLKATEWLEDELLNWSGSVIVASHDRYFLDRVAQRIWELDWGKIEDYRGNYTHYQVQRAERVERRTAEFEAQQQEIAKTEEYIRRFGAGVRATQARGRERRLNRLQRLERPRDHQHLAQKMQASMRSGDMVLESAGMVLGYPDKALAVVPKIYVRRGERIALIGPNGCGKTTLLRTLMGEIMPLDGFFRIGASVVPGYYAQGHEKLERNRTVLDEIMQPGMTVEQARGFAAKYLFSGDDVYKNVGDLSGGERSRVALAKLAQDRSNFLILDEPTNHLDIPSQEALTDMLDTFDGTLLFVSHDRYFIDDLATQIWVVEPDSNATGAPASVRVIEGGYQEYLASIMPANGAAPTKSAHKATVSSRATKSAPVTAASAPKPVQVAFKEDQREQRRLQRLVATVEENIERHEAKLIEITDGLQAASMASDVNKVHELGVEYEVVKAELAALMDEWAELSEQITG